MPFATLSDPNVPSTTTLYTLLHCSRDIDTLVRFYKWARLPLPRKMATRWYSRTCLLEGHVPFSRVLWRVQIRLATDGLQPYRA